MIYTEVSGERERPHHGLRRAEHRLHRAPPADQFGGTADPDGRARHTPQPRNGQDQLPRFGLRREHFEARSSGHDPRQGTRHWQGRRRTGEEMSAVPRADPCGVCEVSAVRLRVPAVREEQSLGQGIERRNHLRADRLYRL